MKNRQNANKKWTKVETAQLTKLAKGNTPTDLIAYKLKRSSASIRSEAHKLEVSLKPINKSPYNRQKGKK